MAMAVPKPGQPGLSNRAGIIHAIATAVAAALALIATVNYLQPPSGWLRRGVVHVAPDGFDGYLGQSRRFAVRTIQRAARLAEPGETILIWPGVYRESVRLTRGGRPGRPLVLRAAVPGQAVISGGADPAVMAHWRWRPVGPHLWSTAVDWRVQGLRWNGIAAHHSGSPSQLRRICARPGAWPAFSSDEHRLWLCLPRGETPRREQLEVSRPMPVRTRSGGHQVASLWIEAPEVEVRDLRFDFVVMAAIQLWHADHVLIEGNQFDGADVAINDNASLKQPRAIRIRHNLSSCFPLFEWSHNGWLSWKELYPYSNCSLVWLRGSAIEVDHNIILQAGDGIKLSPQGGSNRAEGNLIVETTDDGFEFDGEARNLRVVHNLLINPFVAFAISPVSTGPLAISDNIVLIPPRPPQVGYGVLLKLMAGPSRHVSLRRTLYLGYSLGNGVADSPLTDLRIEANGFALLKSRDHGLAQADQITWRSNRYERLSLARWRQGLWDGAVLNGVGGRPRPLGPVGPAWLDLWRDRAAAPLRRYRDSPWIITPAAPRIQP